MASALACLFARHLAAAHLSSGRDSGAVATESLSAFCARRTWASADMTLPRVTLRLDSELSNAVCEMKFCLSSF